jgi:hypothetical protein
VIVKALLVGTLVVVNPALAAASFSDKIKLVAIVLGALIVSVAGIFTIRANAASTWRDEADAQREKAKRLVDEKHALELAFSDHKAAVIQEKTTFETEQQGLRHELKDEIAGLRASLEVERSKPDLSALMERLAAQHEDTVKRLGTEARAAVAEAAKHAESVAGVVDEVHELVNSQKAELERRNAELEARNQELEERAPPER